MTMQDRIANGVDDETFAAWALEVGDNLATETLERICNAHYNDGHGEGVVMHRRESDGFGRYTLVGTIEVGNADHGFTAYDSGDCGTVVAEWVTEA